MNAHFQLTGDALTRFLDRPIYQIIWASKLTKQINFDGDHAFMDMTRENAIEQFLEGNVIKVFEVNLVEGTVRDVTDEIETEATERSDDFNNDLYEVQ